MNQAVERIWIDGGNARILINEISRIGKLNNLKIEVSEGLVLRGLWAWLSKNH
jgi:type III pantothenate kinase